MFYCIILYEYYHVEVTTMYNGKASIMSIQILLAVMDVEKPSAMTRRSDTELERNDEEREKVKRETEQTCLVMGKLTAPCLDRLVASLIKDR